MEEFETGTETGTETYVSQENHPARRISNIKKILLIAIIAITVISVNILVIFNFFPEVIPAKFLYLMAENQSRNSLQKQVDNFFNNVFVKDQFKLLNDPYKVQGDLGFNLNLSDINGPDADKIKEFIKILNTSKLKYDQTVNPKEEKVVSNLSLGVSGVDIKANLFQDKGRIGISVPTIYDKYFIIDTDNLTPIYQKFGETSGPRKLIRNKEILDTIKFDRKEANNVVKDYSTFLINNIQDKEMEFKKDVELSTLDGNIKCNQITIKLDPKRLYDIGLKVRKKMVDDKKLLNLTAGNYINVLKLYDDAGWNDSNPLGGLPEELKSLDGIQKKWKEALAEEEKSPPTNLNTEFIMTLYVDRGFNVLERKVEFVDKPKKDSSSELSSLFNGESVTAFILSNYKQPKSKLNDSKFEIRVESKNNDKTIYSSIMSLSNTELPKGSDKGKNSKITLKTLSTYQDEVQSKFEAVLKNNFIEINNKQQTLTSAFKIIVGGSDSSQDKEIASGKFTSDMKRNSSKKTLDSQFKIDTTVRAVDGSLDSNNKVEISIDSNQKIQFGANVEMPKISSSKSVDLNKAEKEQVDKEIETIRKKAEKFLKDVSEKLNLPNLY